MTTHSEPFLLTTKGSTRATAYGFSNKSITIDRKTHVVWLDAIAKVQGRTFDHEQGEWSSTFDLFEGCDNHTSPALTSDKDKHLRIAYGPHGIWGGWNSGMFKWAISDMPNAIDRWKWDANFGYSATYAGMTHTSTGIDAIVYRGGESPASLMFQRQREKGGWSTAKCLLRQDIEPQYTHYGGIMTCDAAGTLYAGCHFYNVGTGSNNPVTGDSSLMRSYGAAVIKSTDMGETWTDLYGEPFHTPGLYEDRIAVPPLTGNVYMKGLVSDTKGTLWTMSLKPAVDDERILLSKWTDHGWKTTDIQMALPSDRVAIDGVFTIDTKDRIHCAFTAVLKGEEGNPSAWGRPSCEIFHLVTDGSVDGAECNMISIPDNVTASWLPNISLNGPTQPVEKPVILYTHGDKGDGCSPTTTTEAYCVFIDV